MADLSIFKLDSETITIKDTTARQAADSAKALSTTASGNATTALNKVTELESEISALNSSLTTKTGSLIPNDISLNNYEWVSVKQTGNVVNVQFRVKNNGYTFGTEQFNACTVTGVDLPSDSNVFIIGNAYSSRQAYSCEHTCYAVIGTDGKIYIKVSTANEFFVFVSFTYIV